MSNRVLVINPGSTSTKIAVFDDEKKLFQKDVDHDAAKIASFPTIAAQAPYRTEYIEKALQDENIDVKSIDIIMCRGGIILNPPITSGAYIVDENLCTALSSDDLCGPHASLLGGLIGAGFAKLSGANAYIYDAVTSGNLPEIAKITGFSQFKRNSTAHVLNGRAQSIKYAKSIGKKAKDLNVIVCHMGGGTSVMAFKHGELIDTVGDDELHFSAERSGGAQLLSFIELCFSGQYDKAAVKKLIRGKGGLIAHLGTSDGREIENKILAGDKNAENYFYAMVYGFCKSIGALMGIMGEKTDAIILTGGLAYDKGLVKFITEKFSCYTHVESMSGESEMDALAAGGIRILAGEEEAKKYTLPEGYKK